MFKNFSLLPKLVLLIAVPLSAVADDLQLSARVREIDRCVQDQVRIARASGALLDVQTTDVSIFIAEQLSKDIEYVQEQNAWSGRPFTAQPLAYCNELFSAFSTAAGQAIDLKRKSRMGPMGGMPISSESPLIQSYQNLIGRHSRGHSDISTTAASFMKWSGDAATLFARASQAPDLFRWDQDEYHAHTPDVSGASSSERASKIKIGQERTLKRLGILLEAAKSYASKGESARAIVVLGYTAHVLQDLVYHRGMTLAQHSGLAYVKKRNPDTLPGAEGDARFDEAVRRTRWLLESIRTTWPASAWTALATWRKPLDFDAAAIIQNTFGAGTTEDMTSGSLMKYWALSNTFRQGTRPMSELEETPCGSPSGVVCWDVDAVFSDLGKAMR